MQKLQMSTENQEMVKGMLRDLHGEDIEITRLGSLYEAENIWTMTQENWSWGFQTVPGATQTSLYSHTNRLKA